MSNQPTRISRQELYERVWKTTLTQVARELGVTYTELVRTCETLEVPRPPGGYWQRLKLNSPVDIISLPEATATATLEITIGPKKPTNIEVANNLKAEGCGLRPPYAAVVPEMLPNKTPTVPLIPETDSIQQINYTRAQLYEAIWAIPCQKLAKSLGISNVALAKACKRLGIPRPSLGYFNSSGGGFHLPPASSNISTHFKLQHRLLLLAHCSIYCGEHTVEPIVPMPHMIRES
ncbi:MAG TPA: hypothetical protein VMH87_17675 [Pseudomonadales bacterium]|nr:hypothetical protein [Pseudomonadales bacterium]